MTRPMRAVAAATAVAFSTGCFGSFALTRKLWDFNNTASKEKGIKELLFLVFVIVPVYELAALGDALIFNTVEFWGGKNPITAMKDGDRDVIVQRTGDGLHIDVLEPGKAARSFDVAVHEDGAAVLEGGVTIASATGDSAGGIEVFDASGHSLLHKTLPEAEAIAAAVRTSPTAFARLLEQQEAGTLVAFGAR
jgi:uncharacterized protein DUF3332